MLTQTQLRLVTRSLSYLVYYSGKEFAYDYIMREEVVTFLKKTDSPLNIKANPERRSVKAYFYSFSSPTKLAPDTGKSTLILASSK